MKKKFKSVLYVFQLESDAIAILPVSVSSARGSTFQGSHCLNCVIMDEQTWSTEGLDSLIELLLKAPIKKDDSLSHWESVESQNVLPIQSQNSRSTIFNTKKAVRLETWVTIVDDNAPTFGKISIYPSWSPFMSFDIYAFFKLPENEKFLAEINRLLGERPKPI